MHMHAFRTRWCGATRLYLAAGLVLIAPLPTVGQTPGATSQPAATQPGTSSGQTPAKLDHKTLLELASREPIYTPKLKAHDGAELSDAQQAELKTAEEKMASADKAREAGKWADAAPAAQEAAGMRSRVLGDQHHLTITADVASRIARQVAGLSPEAQARYASGIEARAKARSLEDDGRYEDALKEAQKSIDELKAQLGDDHIDVAAGELRKGSILIDLSRFDESNAALSKAQPVFEKTYGEIHPETALLYDRIGWLRIYQTSRGAGDTRPLLQEAVQFLSKAVRGLQLTVGETQETAESLDNLGTALLYLGKANESVHMKLRALFIRETLLGPRHKDTAVSLSNIAWVYARINNLEEAIPLRERALAIFDAVLPKSHPYPYLVRNDLATDYLTMRQPEKAVELLENAPPEDAGRVDALDMGAMMRKKILGDALLRTGRIEDARKALAEVYELAVRSHNNGASDTASNVLTRLIASYQYARMYDDMCRPMETQVQWDDARRGDSDTPADVQRAVRAASVLREVGRPADAQALLEPVIRRARQLGEPATVDLVGALIQQARVHEVLRDVKTAIRFADDAARVAEARFGRQSGLTAFAMVWLGRMNSVNQQYELAEFSLNDAMAILEGLKSEDASARLQILQQQAEHYLRKDDKARAETLFREGLAICREAEVMIKDAYVDASTAAMLRGLVQATEGAASDQSSQRSEWQKELRSRLEKLKKAHALSAEEKAWLADMAS